MKREATFIVTSDSDLGAINVSSSKDSFQTLFNPAYTIPKDAQNIYVSVLDATVWWDISNVVTGTNDKFYVDVDVSTPSGNDPPSGTASYTITLPQGIYDVYSLNDEVNRQIVDAGGESDLINISPNFSSNRTIVYSPYTNVTVDFTGANACYGILGFLVTDTLGPETTYPTYYTATNKPEFNNVEYLLLNSDLISSGINYNGTNSQILAKIIPNATIGSQIQYQPLNPIKISADDLAGMRRDRVRFYITDQGGNSVSTSESWSATIKIEYNY
ncbi:MAG: hypothetical protein OEL89_00610 [Candidatus Peregrinibacteria bacterium]|nr:hypothetical protein [Candidatus Peregrinibacteria bacterium]